MAKTAVGLFESAGRADEDVREIEALGIPRNEVRTLAEPKTFDPQSRAWEERFPPWYAQSRS
jgi:hypothetical protein